MNCNSKSRRAINYSLQEPINNKYDLWLSENLRYNSEGQQIYDSPGQPACDLILKIYKDGDWKPIAGFSTEHIVANKINIVNGVNYTYTFPNDNTLYTNNGFQLNHLPLFRNPQDSPNELFDAGTLGEAIYGFVNTDEWNKIFEGDSFSEAFKYYIEEGDININSFIDPAEEDVLGGIYADEFQEDDMFPEGQDYHSQSNINNSYSWLALAKYKLGYNTNRPEDYNLYISAKDIINIVNKYLDDNQDEPGITPGGGATILPEVLYNSFDNSASIKRDWIINGNNLEASKPRFSLWGACGASLIDNAGKFLKIRDDAAAEWGSNPGPYDDSNNALEWVEIDNIYPVLSEEDHENGTKYVVNGGGKDGTYLDNNGEWTVPTGGLLPSTLIDIIENHIVIRPPLFQDNRDMYIGWSDGSLVQWKPLPGSLTYTGFSPINVNSNNVIEIQGTNDENDVLSSDGRGSVEWKKVKYYNGYGIHITDDNYVYHKIDTDTDGYTATSQIQFNCVIESDTEPLTGITMGIDGQISEILNPCTYTEISVDSDNNTVDINFIMGRLISFMYGNPVYVLFDCSGKGAVNINVISNNDNASLININDAVILQDNQSCLDTTNYSRFLCTMLFGIVKIEPLESTLSSSNNNE